MVVYPDINSIEKMNHTVVTVGTFDGVHNGHKNIIKMLVDTAKKTGSESVVVTFDPHPRTILGSDPGVELLTTLDEKTQILEKLGVDMVVIIPFTKEFSQLTAEEFIREYIHKKLGAVHFIIGHDHKFGKDRVGDEEKLRELGKIDGFEITAVPPVKSGDEIISSSKIRKALLNGDLATANLYLGRDYSFSGLIVEGAKRGRLLGFPTANIEPGSAEKVIPGRGVYVVGCSIEGDKYHGVMNIGMRPTFENQTRIVIEVHILDFNKIIYGKKISVDFIKRIRDEKRFESKEELIRQIELDKHKAIEIINALVN